MLFEIKHRWDGSTIFSAEIKCAEGDSRSVKLGLAVRAAVNARANLTRANLTGADLTRANLTGAYLTGANLTGADLTRANLTGAYLTGANLTGANLTRANLTGADLTGADLTGADLTRANLTGANLTRANLTDAYLTGANLADAYLTGANLADAKDAELAIAETRILPDGDLIGWKKCAYGVIVKLRIPEAAKRSHAFGRKCRAEYATVLEVIGNDFGVSTHDNKTVYRVGETVRCDKWCDDWRQECAGGIHFFITREEAEDY